MRHLAGTICLGLFVVLACAGCGGGGGETRHVFADASVLFPPHFIATGTTADRIRVRGTTVATSRVMSVRVNGVAATSADGYANWVADVPLALGRNALSVDVQVDVGVVHEADVVEVVRAAAMDDLRIGPGPAFDGEVRAPIWDEDGYYAFVLVGDRGGRAADAAMLVTLASGDREVWYDPTGSPAWGLGPQIQDAHSLAWCSPDVFLVADLGAGRVVRVDVLANVGRDVSTACAGAALSGPACAKALEGPDLLIVSDPASQSLLCVDCVAGTRCVVSGPGVGSGPPLVLPRAIAVDAGGDFALVADGGTDGRIVRVDIATGDRTLLTGGGAGSGPALSTVEYVLLQEDRGRLLVTDADCRVVSIDLLNGARRVLTDTHDGGPPCPMRGLARVEASGSLVLLGGDGDVQLADLATGDRVVVSR